MLRSLNDLERYTVKASDGDLGSVANFLFDDEGWVIRYLVVETGGFFKERSVLVSPVSFREVDWSTHQFHLALTKDKIKGSPSIDSEKPVSRQHESDFYRYYGYPPYWGAIGVCGVASYPTYLTEAQFAPTIKDDGAAPPGDAHLRSAKEVGNAYRVQGSDAQFGYVVDFIVDDENWNIVYLVVDTGDWWWGHKVLISPHWASKVTWDDRKVFVNLSRDAIKKSPAWDQSSPIHREYEARLHDHFDRPGYWVGRPPLGGTTQPFVGAGAAERPAV